MTYSFHAVLYKELKWGRVPSEHYVTGGRRGKKNHNSCRKCTPPPKKDGGGGSQMVWTGWIAIRKQLGYLMNDKFTLKKIFNW